MGGWGGGLCPLLSRSELGPAALARYAILVQGREEDACADRREIPKFGARCDAVGRHHSKGAIGRLKYALVGREREREIVGGREVKSGRCLAGNNPPACLLLLFPLLTGTTEKASIVVSRTPTLASPKRSEVDGGPESCGRRVFKPTVQACHVRIIGHGAGHWFVASFRKRKKETRQPKGGMGRRHAATTQGF